MTNGFVGTKYAATKDLRVVDVAKLFRADVKAAVAAGALPKGLKLSVKSDHNAIRVKVTAAGIAPLYSRTRIAAELTNPAASYWSDGYEPRYTAPAAALLSKLTEMLGDYNFDHSDTMTDYFHVRFYDGRAEFAYDLVDADKAAGLAEVVAEMSAKALAALPAYETLFAAPKPAPAPAPSYPVEDWAAGF